MARKSEVISARLSPAELETITTAAAAAGKPVSQYMRDATLREELRTRPGTRTVTAHNGAEILVWTDRWDLWAVA